MTAVLEILRSELQRTMVLMGCRGVRELDASWLIPIDPLVRATERDLRLVRRAPLRRWSYLES